MCVKERERETVYGLCVCVCVFVCVCEFVCTGLDLCVTVGMIGGLDVSFLVLLLL